MRFSRLFVSAVLSSLSAVSATTNIEDIPDELLLLVCQFIPTEMSLRTTSTQLNHVAPFPLNDMYSTWYIHDREFFATVNDKLARPRDQIRLTVSADQYLRQKRFRDYVDGFLTSSRQQIRLNFTRNARKYFESAEFRDRVALCLASPRHQIRLNLGADSQRYFVDAEFAGHVNALVANPATQIRGDIQL